MHVEATGTWALGVSRVRKAYLHLLIEPSSEKEGAALQCAIGDRESAQTGSFRSKRNVFHKSHCANRMS